MLRELPINRRTLRPLLRRKPSLSLRSLNLPTQKVPSHLAFWRPPPSPLQLSLEVTPEGLQPVRPKIWFLRQSKAGIASLLPTAVFLIRILPISKFFKTRLREAIAMMSLELLVWSIFVD